jgi:hypothetical protein
MKRDAIGGYLGLELRAGSVYHDVAIALNTGRNALELIMQSRQYKKGYIPFYTCDAVLSAFKNLGAEYEFYNVTRELEPVFDYDKIQKNEFLLYTNYFGLKDSQVEELSSRTNGLIVDNSQAFYSRPMEGVDAFYSMRKFFGVPDGAFAYIWGIDPPSLVKDTSLFRMLHLHKRLESGAESGYGDYLENEKAIGNLPILEMSTLTHSLAANIDYSDVAFKRRSNFQLLDSLLGEHNEMKLPLGSSSVPLAYPFYSSDRELREKLAQSRIFVPEYWANVHEWCMQEQCIEVDLVEHLFPLPIDQRMMKEDVIFLADKIKDFL